MYGCKTQQKESSVRNENASTQIAPLPSEGALPVVIIYKTTNDYSKNVPVILSDDKTQIVSYPHPSDLILGDNFAYPSKLHKGYLLDNRGIGKNVAFLRFTYEEYAKLQIVPTLKQLYENIIDKNPLIEMWNCGTKINYHDLEKQLNELIDENLLIEKCKQIK